MGQAWFRTVRIALASLIAGLFAFTHASWSQTIINSIQDLQNINNNLAGNYILGGDIDASGFNFTPVGCYGVCPNGFAFTGTLDGNGHTVNNLTIVTNSSYGGLFLGVSGAVRNIGLTNASVASKGFSAIGGIAGINSASIINSYVTGSINGVNAAAGGLVGVNDHSGVISESYANVSVSGSGTGGGQDGGIAGNNYGTISESYATGAVIGSSPGIGSMVGGLVGYNAGSIRQSYSLASAAGANFNSVGGLVGENANTISEAYAAGRVQGGAGNSVGGFVGFAFLPNAIVNNSYWDTQATGWTTSAGGTGLTTGVLQSGSLPTGFDPTVWVGIVGQYPQLQWQVPTKPAFPVVFVHGICSDQTTWDTVKNTLINSLHWNYGGSIGEIGNFRIRHLDAAHKLDADFYTVTFSDPEILSGLPAWDIALQYYLSTIKAFRGNPNGKFIIVAHSAGGLATRSYLQSSRYQNDIAHLITYGTPHSGISLLDRDGAIGVLAFTCNTIPDPNLTDRMFLLAASQGLADMVSGSPFLNGINKGKLPAILYTSLIGTVDDVLTLDIFRALFPLGLNICPVGSDCVVSRESQDLGEIPNAPLEIRSCLLSPRDCRITNDRPHADLPLVPGETKDLTGILWAIRRSMPGS